MSKPIPRDDKSKKAEKGSTRTSGTSSIQRIPRSASPEDEDELGGSMSFIEHLEELRKRLIYSILSVAVTFAASFVFREQIFGYLEQPILAVLQERGIDSGLIITKATDAFTIWLKVCFASGVFLAAPIIVWQIWLFIAPGLYRREKVFAVPFFLSATTLFLGGGLFAYYVILPAGLHFLVVEMGAQFNPLLTAVDFFNFEVIVLVGMGLIFQMPVIIAFLALFDLITPGFLWRNFRYAILIIVIVAAVVSPTPDALNLFFWAAPMILLYTISIGVAWIFQVRRRRQQQEA